MGLTLLGLRRFAFVSEWDATMPEGTAGGGGADCAGGYMLRTLMYVVRLRKDLGKGLAWELESCVREECRYLGTSCAMNVP